MSTRERALAGFVLVLPFLLMWWTTPLSPMTIGNDYTSFPIRHQMEVAFSLEHGSSPLFIPGFAGGQSASALTLAQRFHPLVQLATWLPGYWHGHALDLVTLLRLVSLGLTHLALFFLLRRLRIDPILAAALSLVTVYQLRMLDLFRYGASLESWTGHLLLCVAVAWTYLEPERRRGPIAVVAATGWLTVSGHPQMAYYGFGGALVFAAIFPFFESTLEGGAPVQRARLMRFWLWTGGAIAVGVLLAAAYWLPFLFEFLPENAGRVGRDYAWAVTYPDTLAGTFHNLVLPLRADVHSAFGGSLLFLAAALVPMARVAGLRLPRVVWIVWGVVILLFLTMQGDRTPVHRLAYEIVPFASSFRVAGRVSMLLPIFLLVLLVWLVQAPTQRRFSPRTWVAASAAVIAVAYVLLPGSWLADTTEMTATALRQPPGWAEAVAVGAGVLCLATLAAHGVAGRGRIVLAWTTLAAACVQMAPLLLFGTWVEPHPSTPTLAEMTEAKRHNLDYTEIPGAGLYSEAVLRHVQYFPLEPNLARVYTTTLAARDRDHAYALLAAGRAPDQVVLEEFPETHPFPATTTADQTRVELTFSSTNRLVFEVAAPRPGYLGVHYPFSGHWRAHVNEQEQNVHRANGVHNAVAIPAGRSRVEWTYTSTASTAGWLISCSVLAALGLVGVRFRGRSRWLGGATIALALLAFIHWRVGLYHGENLGTVYTWQPRTETANNLAYGKQTMMSSILDASFPHLHNSGRAVDGDHDADAGFVTGREAFPMWVVDLHDAQPVGSIVVWEGTYDGHINHRPFTIDLSTDGKNWRRAGSPAPQFGSEPWRLRLPSSPQARFVRIAATGPCHLELAEVEVYPPATKEP